MTGPDPAGTSASGASSDAERLLAQALRAKAGGGRPRTSQATGDYRRRLTATQVMLIAVLIGLVVGIGVGLATLLLR